MKHQTSDLDREMQELISTITEARGKIKSLKATQEQAIDRMFKKISENPQRYKMMTLVGDKGTKIPTTKENIETGRERLKQELGLLAGRQGCSCDDCPHKPWSFCYKCVIDAFGDKNCFYFGLDV